MQMTGEIEFNMLGFTFLNYHILFVVAVLIRLFALLFLLPQVREDNSGAVKGVLKHTARKLKGSINSLTKTNRNL